MIKQRQYLLFLLPQISKHRRDQIKRRRSPPGNGYQTGSWHKMSLHSSFSHCPLTKEYFALLCVPWWDKGKSRDISCKHRQRGHNSEDKVNVAEGEASASSTVSDVPVASFVSLLPHEDIVSCGPGKASSKYLYCARKEIIMTKVLNRRSGPFPVFS